MHALSHDSVTDIELFQATGRCVIPSFCFKTNTWNTAVISKRHSKNEIVSLFLAAVKACLYSLLENSTITNFRKGNFYANSTIGKGKGQALLTYQILSDIILFTYLFNPLNPKIKIWILICCPYSFPTEVVGRSC